MTSAMEAAPVVAPDPVLDLPLRPHVDIETAYAAARALQSFSGPVSAERLHATLTRAGADPRWLTGAGWALVSELWEQGATERQARRALAGFTG